MKIETGYEEYIYRTKHTYVRACMCVRACIHTYIRIHKNEMKMYSVVTKQYEYTQANALHIIECI